MDKPAAAAAAAPASRRWVPYEHYRAATRPLVAARAAALRPFAKRYWPLPAVNPLGVTVGEALVGVGLLAATTASAILVKDDREGSGSVAAIAVLAVYSLATRHLNPATLLFGMPYERALRWHFNVGCVALVLSLVHAGACMARVGWRWADAVGEDALHTSGLVLLVLMGSMAVSSNRFLRRWWYSLWLAVHIVLAVATGIAGAVHGAAAVTGGLAIVVIDRAVLGVAYEALFRYRAVTAEAVITALPAGVVRISFPRSKAFRFRGGQWVLLNIPAVSRAGVHPFSLSSAPRDEVVTIHVRALGDWTRALAAAAAAAGPGGLRTRVWMQGPYGSNAVDVSGDRYAAVVLISGGIGVTPLQSTYLELVSAASRGRRLTKVLFLWSVREVAMIGAVYPGMSGHSAADVSAPPLPASFQPDLVVGATAVLDAEPAVDVEKAVQVAASDVSSDVPADGDEAAVAVDGHASSAAGTAAGTATNPAAPTTPPAAGSGGVEEGVFELAFHLTRPATPDAVRTGTLDGEAGALEAATLSVGRLDPDAVMARMAAVATAAGLPRVAVLTCGPEPLTAAVRAAAVRAGRTTPGVAFDVHIEHFAW
ncbi:hypothetical protein I4F81_009325 [Pyropia yezoensis]|uniref:Uncharacterized protein n=1 Tax=Pyropia yezoensis TaxID=2788 RepID=A0ACC3C9R0_PYRYE|nr:hypothetical protein I4F81_009325 [Neopyropia yezoensis]